MTLTELLPAVRQLSAHEKLKLIRILAEELGAIEEIASLENPKTADADEDEPSQERVLEDFRQAWHEAMTGQTIPVSQLWNGIEDA